MAVFTRSVKGVCMLFLLTILSVALLHSIWLSVNTKLPTRKQSEVLYHHQDLQQNQWRTQPASRQESIARDFNQHVLDTSDDTFRDNSKMEIDSSSKKTTEYVVPNYVHFVWLHKSTGLFGFTDMISVLSADRIQKADRIFFHCNILPTGLWWDELTTTIDLELHQMVLPTRPDDTLFGSIDHVRDYTKLEVLLQYGGIVLETDVIIINSLDPLRVYNMTLGTQRPSKVNMAIMVACKHSQFLKLLYESFQLDYQPNSWDYNSGIRPYKLFLKHSDWVHVEQEQLTTPDFSHRDLLFTFNNQFITWRERYVIHLMFHDGEGKIYNPELIKPLKNLVGKVLRYIYYGSPDEITKYMPHIMYSVKLPVPVKS